MWDAVILGRLFLTLHSTAQDERWWIASPNTTGVHYSNITPDMWYVILCYRYIYIYTYIYIYAHIYVNNHNKKQRHFGAHFATQDTWAITGRSTSKPCWMKRRQVGCYALSSVVFAISTTFHKASGSSHGSQDNFQRLNGDQGSL